MSLNIFLFYYIIIYIFSLILYYKFIDTMKFLYFYICCIFQLENDSIFFQKFLYASLSKFGKN